MKFVYKDEVFLLNNQLEVYYNGDIYPITKVYIFSDPYYRFATDNFEVKIRDNTLTLNIDGKVKTFIKKGENNSFNVLSTVTGSNEWEKYLVSKDCEVCISKDRKTVLYNEEEYSVTGYKKLGSSDVYTGVFGEMVISNKPNRVSKFNNVSMMKLI